MFNITRILSRFYVAKDLDDSPFFDHFEPKYHANGPFSLIALTLEKDVEELIRSNEKKILLGHDADIDKCWSLMVTKFQPNMVKYASLNLISQESIIRLAFLVFLRKCCMFEDVFKNIAEFLKTHYPKSYEQDRFYDEAITAINSKIIDEENQDSKLPFEVAVERYMYIDFLVFFVAVCHENNALLKFFFDYPDLLVRNIKNYRYNKSEKFIFKGIVKDFVNNKEKIYDDQHAILENFVMQIYMVCSDTQYGYRLLFGFDNEFSSKCDNIEKKSQLINGTLATTNSLIKICDRMFTKGLFSCLPKNINQRANFNVFLTRLNALRSEECFRAFIDFYNERCDPARTIEEHLCQFRVDIKDEPLIRYEFEYIGNSIVQEFMIKHRPFREIMHIRPIKKLSGEAFESICYFVGINYSARPKDICPISKSLITRPVRFGDSNIKYDLISVVIFWIHFATRRQQGSYKFYDFLNGAAYDIRSYGLDENKSEFVQMFFERSGAFCKHTKDYKFHMSFDMDEENFDDVFKTIMTNFTEFPQLVRDNLEKISAENAKSLELKNAEQRKGLESLNPLEVDKDNEGTDRTSVVSCESESDKSKKSKNDILLFQKKKRHWDQITQAVQWDLSAYRKRL